MPVARKLEDIPFDTMRTGQYWHLHNFTPEMQEQAFQRLRERAKQIDARPIIRTFPSMQISLGYTMEQIKEREKARAEGRLPTPSPQRGRPENAETRLLRELMIDDSVILLLEGRHPKTIRNIAVLAGKKMQRKFSVKDLDGNQFKVTRTG